MNFRIIWEGMKERDDAKRPDTVNNHYAKPSGVKELRFRNNTDLNNRIQITM